MGGSIGPCSEGSALAFNAVAKTVEFPKLAMLFTRRVVRNAVMTTLFEPRNCQLGRVSAERGLGIIQAGYHFMKSQNLRKLTVLACALALVGETKISMA